MDTFFILLRNFIYHVALHDYPLNIIRLGQYPRTMNIQNISATNMLQLYRIQKHCVKYL